MVVGGGWGRAVMVVVVVVLIGKPTLLAAKAGGYCCKDRSECNTLPPQKKNAYCTYVSTALRERRVKFQRQRNKKKNKKNTKQFVVVGY